MNDVVSMGKMISSDDIVNRFSFHPATSDTAPFHEGIRQECRQLAHYINESVIDCREKALAITNLEQVMMWCNAAIARNQ